jgi:PAS domain-containing protein
MQIPQPSMVERLKARLLQFAKGRLYAFAIGTVLALILTNQLLIQYMLYQKRADAHIINLASRQSVLSQQILAQFCRTTRSLDATERQRLQHQLDTWVRVQDGLIYGDKPLGIPPCGSESIKAKLLKAQKYIHSNQIKLNLLAGNAQIDLARLTTNQNDFLAAMEDIVADLETQAEDKLTAIVWAEALLAMFSLLVLFGEYAIIFRPILAELEAQKKLLVQENQAVKATREKLMAILNSTTDLNVLIGPNQEVLSVNKAAQDFVEQVVGQPPAGTHLPVMDYLAIHNRAEFEYNFKLALGGQPVAVTKKIEFAQGHYWFLMQYFPARDEQGRLIGVSFNAKDINKEQERYEKLLAINWTHSHEIRRPLANMMGLLPLLEWDELSDENREVLGYFQESIGELDAIIHKVVQETQEGKGIVPPLPSLGGLG